jgi:hypothetical protein
MTFLLYILYLMLTYLRPIETYFPELYEFRPVLIFGVLTLFLSILSAGTNKPQVINRRHIGLISALMFIVPFSRITNGWLGGATDALLAIAPQVAAFILTVINVNTLRKLKITILTIFICTIVLILQSLYSYYTGYRTKDYLISQSHLGGGESRIEGFSERYKADSALPVDDKSVLWRIRSVGELRDPNDFAQTILAAAPILIVGFITATKVEKLLIRIPLLAILSYGLFLTGSRGAVVAAAGMAFFMSYRRLGKTRASLLVTLTIIIGVALGFSGGRGISANDDSAGGRIEAWSAGFSAWAQHPLFGVGFGRFLEYHSYTAHNAYVLILTELGMIGYFFWVSLAMNSVLELLKGRAALPPNAPEFNWANCVLLSFVAVAISSLFLSRSYSTVTYIWIGLMACSAAICRNSTSSATVSNEIPWARYSWRFCFLTTGIFYLTVITYNLSG